MSDAPPELPDSVPEITRAVTRGAARLLNNLGQGVMTEFSLVTGRRVDVIGIDRAGHVTVIEVKASVADFKGDSKWTEYLEFCDSFYFAVAPDFPRELLPEEARCGLIIADRFGAEILRQATPVKLPAARRKAVTLRFARTATRRLQSLLDPLV
ncbi:MAG: MmcB family DNA repair protein [Proteobacteria bacterium]|nr:MmcB family DNA repair protein [Pseudomonadota bacterium]